MDSFESFSKAVEDLVEVWQKFMVTVNEAVEALGKLFEQFQEEKKKVKALSSPRKYGMSLIRQNEQILIYHYIPVVRKNLPYQRRRF